MKYSIGEVSELLNIPVSTLRYYDKEGLLLDLERDSGVRKFSERNIDALRLINCLKSSGMQIKDIKEFMHLVSLGNKTISKRKDFFYKQKEEIENKIKDLEKALNMVKFKCWYYETAENDKTEERVKNIKASQMPENIRLYYETSHN